MFTGELPEIELVFFLPKILARGRGPILAGETGFRVLTDIGRFSGEVVPVGDGRSNPGNVRQHTFSSRPCGLFLAGKHLCNFKRKNDRMPTFGFP